MRRREKVRKGGMTAAADGVFWWREYPGPEPADPDAVEAWSQRFQAWCDEHGVDEAEVTFEATQLGLTDIPFNPDDI